MQVQMRCILAIFSFGDIVLWENVFVGTLAWFWVESLVPVLGWGLRLYPTVHKLGL